VLDGEPHAEKSIPKGASSTSAPPGPVIHVAFGKAAGSPAYRAYSGWSGNAAEGDVGAGTGGVEVDDAP
jgi:hypothetical protein